MTMPNAMPCDLMRAMAENPLQNVTFESNGSSAHGYLALPDSGRGPGLIVIQEWWGLVDHIADVTNRFAAEGFVALAPDLYGGRTTHDAQEASELMQQLPVEDAARDLAGAVDYLLSHDAVTSSTIGAVGFCMGGGFVLVLAAQQGDRIGAAVPFYGVPPAEPIDFSGLTAPVLGHYGERDGGIPPATRSSTTRTRSVPMMRSRRISPGAAPRNSSIPTSVEGHRTRQRWAQHHVTRAAAIRCAPFTYSAAAAVPRCAPWCARPCGIPPPWGRAVHDQSFGLV